MGTWNIRGSRTRTAYRNLVRAALASAIALALLMPVTAGARSGAAVQPAPTSGSTGVTRKAVPAPIPGSLMTSSRETGCCA